MTKWMSIIFLLALSSLYPITSLASDKMSVPLTLGELGIEDRTLSPSLLRLLLDSQPKEKKWTSAMVQCWNLMAWAHLKNGSKIPDSIFEENTTSIKEHALPPNLVKLIHERLPRSFSAKLFKKDHFNKNELEKTIEDNIDADRPLLIYYVDEDEKIRIRMIAGYKKDHQEQINAAILLTKNPNGDAQLQTIAVGDLKKIMDMESLRWWLPKTQQLLSDYNLIALVKHSSSYLSRFYEAWWNLVPAPAHLYRH